MATCLRQFLKKSRSIMLVIQRNRQTDCLSQKVTGSYVPSTNEVVRMDYFQSDSHCACNLKSNTPVGLVDIAGRNFVSRICVRQKSNSSLISKSGSKCLRVGDMLYFARECKAYKEYDQKMNDLGKAEPAQIEFIYNSLSKQLPTFFKSGIDFGIYHPNIVFENNIGGTKTVGLTSYITQLTLIRGVAHLKYARIGVDLLKITAHPEDGTVRVRWRIRCVSALKHFLRFLKCIPALKSTFQEGWIDGFSIYYVRSDGLVHKHVVLKMIPDSNEKSATFDNSLAAKIAVALGLTLKECSSAFFFENSSLFFENNLCNAPVPRQNLLILPISNDPSSTQWSCNIE